MSGLTVEHFREAWQLVSSVPAPPNIIESKYCGKPVLRFRFRTWRERLFTLPWQPFKKMAFFNVWVATGKLYYLENQNVIIGHPGDVAQTREGKLSSLSFHPG